MFGFLLMFAGTLWLSACGGSKSTPLPTATPFSLQPVTPAELLPLPDGLPLIERYPSPTVRTCEPKTQVEKFDYKSYDLALGVWQVDYRGCDLSAIDFRRSLNDVLFATFDNLTIWPTAEKMPSEFNPQQVLTMGKTPGPGLRQLHASGVTGHGVGIALIDHTLLADHEAIASQLRFYDESDGMPAEWPNIPSYGAVRGTALASLLVGKETGVAPGADLYYFGIPDCVDADLRSDYACLAEGLTRLQTFNEQLPPERKIRVVVIPLGFRTGERGYDLVAPIVKEIKDSGVMVLFPTTSQFKFLGMGRSPLGDPDRYESYGPSLLEEKGYFERVTGTYHDRLFFPMDSHVLASPTGPGDYFLLRQGSNNEAITYLGGAYALALQVQPDLTPDDFWALALETATEIKVLSQGKTYSFGPVADLPALIQALQKGK
jgi:hypothetical protein